MFVTNPGNIVQALDAVDGSLLWEYRYIPPKGTVEGVKLRSLAVWEDMIYVATHTGGMVALDARTGTVRWETQIEDIDLGYENTSGPIVVKGKVINGINNCRIYNEETCFITAHDARTGEELWRTSTIPLPNDRAIPGMRCPKSSRATTRMIQNSQPLGIPKAVVICKVQSPRALSARWRFAQSPMGSTALRIGLPGP